MKILSTEKLLIILLSLSVFWKCAENKKVNPWNAALYETTIYSLISHIDELKKHAELAEQYQGMGKNIKAKEEIKLINQKIDKIEYYLIPLINSKAHLSAAFNFTIRDEFTEAENELKKCRSQLLITKSKVSGQELKEIKNLNMQIEALEKELKKMSNVSYKNFSQAAVQIDNIINR
ncbi:MAG: hypothetical protein AB7T22_05195 [Calditrichaceae bacterium]